MCRSSRRSLTTRRQGAYMNTRQTCDECVLTKGGTSVSWEVGGGVGDGELIGYGKKEKNIFEKKKNRKKNQKRNKKKKRRDCVPGRKQADRTGKNCIQ